MKKILLITLAAGALLLAGCGRSHGYRGRMEINNYSYAPGWTGYGRDYGFYRDVPFWGDRGFYGRSFGGWSDRGFSRDFNHGRR